MMDALTFLKEKKRMCESYKLCDDWLDSRGVDFAKQVSVVEKWSKEHPAKTRASEFLKQYPNASINSIDKLPSIVPCLLDISIKERLCKHDFSCTECREKYWLEEIEE